MPRVTPDESIATLFIHGRRALGVSQEELGELLGASRRTVGRWEYGKVVPSPSEIGGLARAVYAQDPGLAAQLAEQAGETLLSLKLEAPPPAPLLPPPRPTAPIALMVESVVCAAAEALDTKPSAVRDVIRAAFQRARAMSLTVEEVDDALRPASAVRAVRAVKGTATPSSRTRTVR